MLSLKCMFAIVSKIAKITLNKHVFNHSKLFFMFKIVFQGGFERDKGLFNYFKITSIHVLGAQRDAYMLKLKTNNEQNDSTYYICILLEMVHEDVLSGVA